jgi:hypothetical protein
VKQPLGVTSRVPTVRGLDDSSHLLGSRFFVQSPTGERKSGMPHSVEIPAPVNGAITRALSTKSCNSSMAVSRSGAVARWVDLAADGAAAARRSIVRRRYRCEVRVTCG